MVTLTLSLDGAAILLVVGVLGCVQIPMDFQRRVLSRQATLLAGVAIILVIATTSVTSRDLSSIYQTVGCGVVVTVVYALLHQVSPQSLGLGDVLLVVPLTLAVAHANLRLVLWWQLLAAATGAMHAVVVTRCRGRASIPFGPHLILTAWALLLVGV